MSSSRVFYGWWITLAFSIMVFVSAGVRHAVGPFLKPMVADLGVDRASFSLVIALESFAPTDRHSSDLVMKVNGKEIVKSVTCFDIVE